MGWQWDIVVKVVDNGVTGCKSAAIISISAGKFPCMALWISLCANVWKACSWRTVFCISGLQGPAAPQRIFTTALRQNRWHWRAMAFPV
jgi:hypothetical protein